MLDGWSLLPQWGVMVLQQLSGTTLSSAGSEEMYALIIQSWELLLPQHLNWRGRKRKAKGFGFTMSHTVRKSLFFSYALSQFFEVQLKLIYLAQTTSSHSILNSSWIWRESCSFLSGTGSGYFTNHLWNNKFDQTPLKIELNLKLLHIW